MGRTHRSNWEIFFVLMNKTTKILFAILRKALFGQLLPKDLFANYSVEQWTELYRLAARQGVLAIVYDVISQQPKELQPPRNLNIQWALSVDNIHNYFSAQYKAADDLAELFKSNGIQMLVMKGLSLARYYPKPYDRECGDIDIYSFDNFAKSNEIIKNEGIEIDFHHEKHAVFRCDGVLIEHHETFLNVHTKVGKILNDYLLEVCTSDNCMSMGSMLYPNADFNAVFLLRHMTSHFSQEGITLRNIIDWALFLANDGQHINRAKYVELLHQTGMVISFNVFTAVSADVLGVDFSEYYIGKPDAKLTERVEETILATKLHSEAKYKFVKRFYKKTCRLFFNRWQYRQLLPDKFWSEIVIHSVKAHIKNPRNI